MCKFCDIIMGSESEITLVGQKKAAENTTVYVQPGYRLRRHNGTITRGVLY